MDGRIITGVSMAAGAAAYCVWGFIEAYKQTQDTPIEEKFNWLKAAITVLPSIAGGFAAGYALNAETIDIILLIMAGFGAAAAQAKLGINSYFD